MASLMSLSLSLSPLLSLWGEAVNNAGGLADLCEPQAPRKAGVPGGRLAEREGREVCNVVGGGIQEPWVSGWVPGEHTGNNPLPTAPKPHPHSQISARSTLQGQG